MSITIKYFSGLSGQEAETLLKAPAQITVLIAGADGDIASKEIEMGEKLVNYRTFTAEVLLHNYYEAVKVRMEDDLNEALDSYVDAPVETLNGLIAALSDTNDILRKLDPDYKKALVDSWRSLARKVAEAQGGLFGYGSIDEAEKKLIDLPMISA